MDDEADKIKGLMAGGDDYITKPYSLKELAARVYAQVRRSSMKGFVIDHQNQLLRIDNRIIPWRRRNLSFSCSFLAIPAGSSRQRNFTMRYGVPGSLTRPIPWQSISPASGTSWKNQNPSSAGLKPCAGKDTGSYQNQKRG